MKNRLGLRDVKKYKKELNVPFLIFLKKYDIIYIENKKKGYFSCCLPINRLIEAQKILHM